jgi:uncharacterized protein (TIRG00374 family)
MKMKNQINIAIGLTITLFGVWLAFRKVPFIEISDIISGGNYYWLIPAAIAQLLAILLRSQRWVVLPDRKDELEVAFWAQGIGYLFTNLFPFRLGEVARVLVMSESCKMPVVQVTGTAIVERLLDVGTMIFALVLVLPWMQVPGAVIKSGQIFGALVLVGSLVIILLAQFKETSFATVNRICTVFPVLPKEMILARWAELTEGLTPLLRGSIAFQAVLFSLLSWLFSGAVFYCAIRTFEPAGLPLEAVFMMVALSLAVVVPSSPGFVGVFQLVGQQALVIPFGKKYSVSSALAITLIAHLVYYVLSTLVRIIGLWRIGRSFADLKGLVVRKNATV